MFNLLNWKSYAAVAAVAALLASGATWRVMSWREGAQQAKTVTRTIKQIGFQQDISFEVGAKFADQVRLSDAHTQFLILEIPQRVTPEIDRTYPVPCGYVRMLNEAWHGPVSDPAGCPDAAPADTALSAVAQAQVVNAGEYDRVAAQLTALQDWIRQQQALSEKQ